MKFVHTVASGYVTGAMFILGISAWYMLKGRDFAFAKRSFAIAASFGMAAVLSVIVLGDESGYEMGDVQKPNWLLSKPSGKRNLHLLPLLCSAFLIRKETNKFAIQIPYALGIIATRSVDTPVIGLKELMVQHEERIRNGMKAYSLLEQLRSGSTDRAVRDQFNSMKKDLGYGLLLKRYTPNVADATEAQIQQATKDSIPRVAPLYLRSVSWWRVASCCWQSSRSLSGVSSATALARKNGCCARAVRYSAAVDCCRSGLVRG